MGYDFGLGFKVKIVAPARRVVVFGGLSSYSTYMYIGCDSIKLQLYVYVQTPHRNGT